MIKTSATEAAEQRAAELRAEEARFAQNKALALLYRARCMAPGQRRDDALVAAGAALNTATAAREAANAAAEPLRTAADRAYWARVEARAAAEDADALAKLACESAAARAASRAISRDGDAPLVPRGSCESWDGPETPPRRRASPTPGSH